MNTTTGLRATIRTLAAVPTLAFLTFGTYALRARWALGRWPTFSNPDPKDLGFDIHHFLSILSLTGSIGAPIVLLIVIALSWRWLGDYRARACVALAVCLVTLVTLAWFMRADPAGLSEWLVD